MFKKKKFIICIIAVLILFALIFCGVNKLKIKEKPIYLSEVDNIEEITFKRETESEIDFNVIGYLRIDSLEIEEAPIAEGTSMEILNKYIGHFEETPYINGNIVLCAHNRGYENNYFENLKDIKLGALIEYMTKNETFIYKVIDIRKIEETDMSVIEQKNKSQLTLITCVENQPQYRYCIIAEKVWGKVLWIKM